MTREDKMVRVKQMAVVAVPGFSILCLLFWILLGEWTWGAFAAPLIAAAIAVLMLLLNEFYTCDDEEVNRLIEEEIAQLPEDEGDPVADFLEGVFATIGRGRR